MSYHSNLATSLCPDVWYDNLLHTIALFRECVVSFTAAHMYSVNTLLDAPFVCSIKYLSVSDSILILSQAQTISLDISPGLFLQETVLTCLLTNCTWYSFLSYTKGVLTNEACPSNATMKKGSLHLNTSIDTTYVWPLVIVTCSMVFIGKGLYLRR